MATGSGETKPLTIEEAIKTAIEFETKVRGVYHEAMKKADNKVGQKIFRVLAMEEQHHLDYLNERLDELKEGGEITVADLDTLIPDKSKIESEVSNLRETAKAEQKDTELKLLQRAVEVELQTSEFYKRMANELDGNGQKMFARFVEIEEGHVAVVQAELDAVSGMGFFFGMEEFNLEMGG